MTVRVRRRLLLVPLLGLLCATTAPLTAVAVPDRQQPCREAWALVAEERSGLAEFDLSSWARVNDAFLSMADATFDGPLSNAFGNVSAAAEVVTLALQSDSAGGPPRTEFDAALGALGTVCAQLSVTKHGLKVPRFQRFAYQTGTLTGLNPEAGARANATIALSVDRAVQAARRANGTVCPSGAGRCGYFVQSLKMSPCIPGLVCVRSTTGILPVGANDGQGFVTTMPFDALTGEAAPLTTVVPAAGRGVFLARVNTAIRAKLAAGGLADDSFWAPHVKLKDVRAWLPQPDGIHVWFDKFAVAPGSFGIVHVVVPWPAGGSSA